MLDAMTHIARRPSLYLGATENMKNAALRKVIDRALVEFRLGHGKTVKIILHEDGSATVEDSGRGSIMRANLGAQENDLDEIFGKLSKEDYYEHTENSNARSLGLTNTGVPITNAVSSRFDVQVYTGHNEIHSISYKKRQPGHFDTTNNEFTHSQETNIEHW